MDKREKRPLKVDAKNLSLYLGKCKIVEGNVGKYRKS